MVEYICNLCNRLFSSNQSLERHQNRKIKCNIRTEFKCSKCNKCFKQKKNLLDHQNNKTCNNIKLIEKIDNKINIDTIIEILKNNEDDKIFLLKALGVSIIDIELNKIINSKISNEAKADIIKNNLNKSIGTVSNSNNKNSNNTTNININNFGNESVDYLSTKYFEKLLLNNYGKDSFLKLSNEIYLNKDKPNNNTIKVDNIDNKYCKIIENNKWITTTKDAALQKIFLKVSNIILLILEDVKDSVPEKRREIVTGYLEKDFEDPYIKETIKDFILNIYNFTTNEI